MSPSFALHGCQQESHSSGEPACLLLFQECSSSPRGSSAPWEPWSGWAGAARSALSWEGEDGCRILWWAPGESGTAARLAAFGIAHVHQAASVRAESAHTGAARAGEALQAGIFHEFITQAELVKSRRWAVSKLHRNVTLLPHLRFLLHNRECL